MRKPATFTFSEELLDRLDKYSKRTMIPKARLLERAITDYLDRAEQEEQKEG